MRRISHCGFCRPVITLWCILSGRIASTSIEGDGTIFQENPNLLNSGGGAERPMPRGRQDELLPILWRQRKLIAGCAAACIFVAMVYLLFATPIYTSTARMSVKVAASRLTGQAQAITDYTEGNYLFTEQQLIKSPSVLALAAQMPEVKPFLRGQTDPIGFIQNNLSVDVGKRDTIISVSFSSPNPGAAADIANGIVKAYQEYQTKPKPSDTADLDRLAEDDKRLDKEIGNKNEQMRALEQKYGLLATANERDGLLERQLASLSQELHTAHLETLKAQAEENEAKAAVQRLKIKGIDVNAVDTDMLALGPDQEALIRTEMLQLEARIQDLRQHYLPDHPYIQTQQRRMDQLEVIYAHAVQRRYLVTKQREQDLQAAFDQQQRQAIEVSAKAAEYARLQEDARNIRNIKANNDQRRRELERARDLGMMDINPFEPAEIELKPSHPSKKVTLALAMLLGLILGGGLGYLRDWLDDRFRTADDIKSMGVPLLGSVPKMPELPPALAGQQALLEPMSDVAEACRTIRTAIYFGAPKDRCRTLLITSPAPNDGKSTLASNLAIAMAQSGKRVLLVDADLRLASQHTIFHVPNEIGLSSLLEGQVTLDQAVQQTPVNGLEILPCGPKPPSPSEMLNSPMFSELLEVLSDRYDQVIVDSPPVMGVADARIIAASCDITVLVLRAQKSTRRLSEMARDGLCSVGGNLLGIVINDVSPEHAGPYGSYGYARERMQDFADKILSRQIAAKNGG